jgi:hypothetical protein
VTVTHETPLRLPRDWKNSGGMIPREITLRIDRTFWRRPGGPTVGGQIHFNTWGWMMESDQEADSPKHPLAGEGAPRLQAGRRYLALIMRMRGEWFAVGEATLTLDGDLVTAEVEGEPSEAVGALKGKTISEAVATVAGTTPHPGAAEHAKLPPAERYQAIEGD